MLAKIGLLLVICTIAYCQNANTLFEFNIFEALEEIDTRASNSECMEHMIKYRNGLLSGKPWALRMMDSSAKIPDGILDGNTGFFGHYDECIDTEDDDKEFVGQHCLLDVTLTLSKKPNITFRNMLPQTFQGEKAGEAQFIMTWQYGVCLPSSCTAEEIQNALQPIFNHTVLSIKADPGSCSSSIKTSKLSAGDWVVVAFLVIVGLIAVSSTAYDVNQRLYRKNDKPHPILSSFSIYSNGKQLFQISDSAGQMKALHGLRTLSMSWVILCHSYGLTASTAMMNKSILVPFMKSPHKVFVTNGFVSVDTFFFLSGLLVCFVFFRDVSKKGGYDILLGYIHRYIRLTPPLALMILFNVTIYLYIGDGPVWNRTSQKSADVCKDHWWAVLIYVQNFVAPKGSCLGQTWYLSTDMQLYWLAPLVLYPTLFWPVIGTAFTGFLILASAALTFALAYVNNLGPSFVITHSDRQQEIDYTPFYTRATPWLAGVLLGFVICGIQAKKIRIGRLPKLMVAIGWLFSTGVCLGVVYSVLYFTHNNYTDLDSAFYLPFYRIGWSLGLIWITFACLQGYGGPVNTFLSWGIFQPLGKLSYCSFLIHTTVMGFRAGTQRTTFYIAELPLLYNFLGDWVITNLFAIPVTLLFEMPFCNIDRYLFSNVKIFPYPKPRERTKAKEIEDAETGKVNPGFESSPKDN